MSQTMPMLRSKVKVICPSMGLSAHVKVQQYISALTAEPNFHRDMTTICVVRRSDYGRLFGEVKEGASHPDLPVKGFYVLDESTNIVSFVGVRAELDRDDLFVDIVALEQNVLAQLIGVDLKEWLSDIENENPDLPELRLVALMRVDAVDTSLIPGRITSLTEEEYNSTEVMFKWDADLLNWDHNTDDIVQPVQTKRLNMKDIPLTSRNGRRLVRNSVAQNLAILEDAYARGGSQLSFDDWMVQNQGVNVYALRDLEGIDALPDSEYVAKMVKFKQAEATGYHNKALENKETELHLFDWVLQQFGVEFVDLGRKEAAAEILDTDVETGDTMNKEDEELPPAVFLITFDGTIVEDARPVIGPESPFALATIRKLIEKGHKVFILTDRTDDEFADMKEFFDTACVEVLGAVDSMPASGKIYTDYITNMGEELLTEDLPIDYLVDHRQYGITTVQISGRANGGSTYYWGDLLSRLHSDNYFTDADVEEISASVKEDQ